MVTEEFAVEKMPVILTQSKTGEDFYFIYQSGRFVLLALLIWIAYQLFQNLTVL